VHPTTLTRWALEGIRLSTGQRVKLRALRLPGGWRVTTEWLVEFVEQVTADRLARTQPATPAPTAPRSPAQRTRDLKRATDKLKDAGIVPR
jgi:hypothetical protein